VFVRAGELNIGSKTALFANEATITLHGKRQDDQIVLNSAVEAGNRILMNIANMSMYGKPRDSHSRLHTPALKNSVHFMVGPALDWKSGDEIALAPTSFSELTHEMAEILFYDASTGNLTVKTPLKFYHHGQQASTEELYGTDVRGEVIMLTRNIKIRGKWECTILTSDYIEFDMSQRNGQTIMDNVEIRDCSQENTHKTALRFQNAHGRESSITNSAIHSGMSWAINVQGASNLKIKGNVIYDFKTFGINVQQGNNIHIEDNIVISVQERRGFNTNNGIPDKWAGIAMCTNPMSVCPGSVMKNNIVAGATYIGFTALGTTCGQDNSRLSNNTAHSIGSVTVGFGHGAIVIGDKSQPAQQEKSACMEISGFNTYKCNFIGLTGGMDQNWEVVKYTKNNAIDSKGGIGATMVQGWNS